MSEAGEQAERLVGIEVSDSRIAAVNLAKDGKVLGRHQVAFGSAEDRLEQIVAFIEELKSRFGGFSRVGIAVPGLIERSTKRVAYSTHAPEHQEIDFLAELESRTGVQVVIENDANSAAYGEYKLGAGKGSENLFYATLGKGVGGALILAGRIWHGASGFAGEFGHIAINSDGTKLEDVASADNIVRRTRNRFHQDHTSSLSSMKESEITVTDIVREARRGDDFAQMMLERTGLYIGTAIASVINLLNIEKIVVGGEIVQGGNSAMDAIIRSAREFSFGPSFQATSIVPGKLGENAAAVGVALLSSEV